MRKVQSQNSDPTAFSLSSRKTTGNISNFVGQILNSKFVCRPVLLLSSLSIGRKHREFPFLLTQIWKQLMSLLIHLPMWETTLKKLKSSFSVVLVLFSSTIEVPLPVLGFSVSKIFVLQNPVLTYSFGLGISVVKKEFYKGKDCIQQLMKLLWSWSTWCFNKKQICKLLRISKDDKISLLNQDDWRCCSCG